MEHMNGDSITRHDDPMPNRSGPIGPQLRYVKPSPQRGGVHEGTNRCRPLLASVDSVIRHRVAKWLTDREACKLYATGARFCSSYILLRLQEASSAATASGTTLPAIHSLPPRRQTRPQGQSLDWQEAEVGALTVLAVLKFRADRKRVLRKDLHRLSRHQLRTAVRTLIHRLEHCQGKKLFAPEMSTLLGLTATAKQAPRTTSPSTGSD